MVALLRSRWTALAGAVLVEHVGGLFYMFGAFSPTVKHSFKLSQDSLDTMGSMANLGGNFGMHYGFLLDAVGPGIVLVVAGLLGFFGWGTLWASIYFAWPMHNNTWGLDVMAFVQGQSQQALDTAVIPTITRHFSQDRGASIGITKAFVGLSGALASQLYAGFFAPDVLSLMLFLSFYVLIVCSIGACLVFAPKSNADGDSIVDMRSASWGMKISYRIVIVLCLMLLGIVIGDRAYDPSPSAFVGVAQTLSVFSVFIGLMVFMVFTGIQEEEKTPLLNISSNDIHAPLLGNARIVAVTSDEDVDADENVEGSVSLLSDQVASTNDSVALEYSTNLQLDNEQSDDSVSEDQEMSTEILTKSVQSLTLGQALKSLEFYLHFMALMLGCGCGLVLINNLGQLTSVVGLSDADQKVLVSLQSVFNCFGRLIGGWLSDVVLSRYGFTRPSSLAVTMMCMCAAMIILSIATPAALFIGTILAGLSYGSIFALSPVMAGEHFGVKYLGSIYTSLSPGISVGSFGLASFLFAGVYDANKPKHKNSCHGPACVRLTFCVCAVLCFLASLLCLWLARRTRSRFVALYPQYSALRR